MSSPVRGGMLFLSVALALTGGSARIGAGQASNAQAPIDVAGLVDRVIAGIAEYARTFRNLTAEETKIIETFKSSGEIDKRREIVSDLLVYHSPREGTDVSTEYRDVRTVDGKPIKQRSERALNLIGKAVAADSLEKELRAINNETRRYEFNCHINGFTINQGGPPLRRYRNFFDFTLAGREQLAGHDVVVLDYRQRGAVPGFGVNPPKAFGNAAPVHSGRLWVDADTGQLWRYVWDLAYPHPQGATPIVMIHTDSIYTASRFGIPVPQRIVLDCRTRFSQPKNGAPSLGLSERATFTYGAFRRFEVASSEAIAVQPR